MINTPTVNSQKIYLALGTVSLMLLLISGFIPYQAPITLYHLMITGAQHYLKPHLEGLDLTIHRYQEFDRAFQIARAILVALGIPWVYLMTRKKNDQIRSWITSFIKISARIAIQFTTILSLLTIAGIGSLFVYFGMKLQALKPPQADGNFFLQLLEKFNPLYFLKAGWKAFNTLVKAQTLFETINRVNYGLYITCQLIGICAGILFFILIAKKMNKRIE